MSEPIVLCACGQPAAWRGHNDGADLCDDCMTWGHEPIWAAVNLPFSAGLIARRRQTVASLALAGDMEADDLQTARWLATLEAAERERDALRAAVRALLKRLTEEEDDELAELSLCDRCDVRLATRRLATRHHKHAFCDACDPTDGCDYYEPGDPVTDLPHATALRALFALLPPEVP